MGQRPSIRQDGAQQRLCHTRLYRSAALLGTARHCTALHGTPQHRPTERWCGSTPRLCIGRTAARDGLAHRCAKPELSMCGGLQAQEAVRSSWRWSLE
jgi:hypothetical protein